MSRSYVEGTWQRKNRAFSPAVITEGGRMVWAAGHGAPVDEMGNSLAGDFAAQTRQSFTNLSKTLEEAGAGLADLVTMTVFIIDARHGDEFTKIRREYFPDGNFPASAMLTVAGFAQPAMMVEIQGIAVVD
ncbi:MAG: RidA family protein [Proteobacteria bacterium]|nr:RidA family protein [Pseudomonadota bacterium]